MKIENVCVVGGTGFLGRALAEQLCARMIAVRVLTRHPGRARSLTVLPTLEYAIADPHDEATLVGQFTGADAVVNLVGILHEHGRQTFESVHVDLPRKVARACRAAGVRRLLHVSALGASESAPSEYLRSKARGEAAIREGAAGTALTVFRPSVLFGEGDHFLNLFAALARWFPVIPLARPEALFQPIWVEDAARALTLSLADARTFEATYSLCGPRRYRLRELWEFVLASTAHRRWILGLPDWAAELQAGLFEHLPGPLLTRDNLRSMSVDNVCDAPFPAVFGFQPATLEAVAPGYLGEASLRDRYMAFRDRGGR